MKTKVRMYFGLPSYVTVLYIAALALIGFGIFKIFFAQQGALLGQRALIVGALFFLIVAITNRMPKDDTIDGFVYQLVHSHHALFEEKQKHVVFSDSVGGYDFSRRRARVGFDRAARSLCYTVAQITVFEGQKGMLTLAHIDLARDRVEKRELFLCGKGAFARAAQNGAWHPGGAPLQKAAANADFIGAGQRNCGVSGTERRKCRKGAAAENYTAFLMMRRAGAP